MEGVGTTGIGRSPVERGFEIAGERVVAGFVRSRATSLRGWHRPRAKLPHHPFPNLRVLRDAIDVDLVEREAARFETIVMTADAVACQQGAVRRNRCGHSGS
jgi:hypothetical protein